MSRIKQWTWTLLKAILVVALIAGVVYQWKFSPLAVRSHTVQRGGIVAEVMGTGTLEARVSATISPKIAGRVVEILVDQGQRVTVGDVLVRLDDDELNQQVAIADANVDAAKGNRTIEDGQGSSLGDFPTSAAQR